MTRKRYRLILLGAILLTGLLALSETPAQPPQQDYNTHAGMMGGMMHGGMMNGGMMNRAPADGQSDGSAGAALFESHCASCHRGGGNVIVPLLPLKGSKKLADFETFLAFIRHPRMPDGSLGAMPAFGQSSLSDEQARQLYRYLLAEERDAADSNR